MRYSGEPGARDLAVTIEHLLQAGSRDLAVADDELAVDDRVAGADGAAAQPGLDRIAVRASELHPFERPDDEIGGRARCDDAELAHPAETGSRAEGRHL